MQYHTHQELWAELHGGQGNYRLRNPISVLVLWLEVEYKINAHTDKGDMWKCQDSFFRGKKKILWRFQWSCGWAWWTSYWLSRFLEVKIPYKRILRKVSRGQGKCLCMNTCFDLLSSPLWEIYIYKNLCPFHFLLCSDYFLRSSFLLLSKK